MVGIAQLSFYQAREMSLTVKTLDLGIELRKLHCFTYPGESYKVTVTLEGENSTSSNLTVTHAGHTDSGWFDAPISTDEHEFYLLPNSEYKLTVAYDNSYYYRRMDSSQINVGHFVLKDLHNCYGYQYCTPMIHVAYRTLTRLSTN